LIAGQDIHAAVNQALQTHGWTNVSVEIIENSGHYVADEQPTALAALIERYASM
jgi:pimeloyl-ACP methyl ester carboxylesterase